MSVECFADAGKSTIGGHIMYLTGGVDKRTLEKYQREAKEKNRDSWSVFIFHDMMTGVDVLS